MGAGTYKGVKYFSPLYFKEKKKPWFGRINLGKGLLNMINRLRADHYNLNDSLCRKNYIESPRCEYGAEKQDIDYVCCAVRITMTQEVNSIDS